MNSSHDCRSIIKAGHGVSGADGPSEVLSALVVDDPGLRRAALGAALRLGVLDAGHLRRALADPELQVRYRGVELAARSPIGVEVAPSLIEALDDDELAEVAAFALGELPLEGNVFDQAVEALKQQATGHDDPLCREAAVAALGALGAGLESILAATGDVAAVRRRAVLALAPFDDPRVDTSLRAALEDRDWQVRQAAEDLLDSTEDHQPD